MVAALRNGALLPRRSSEALLGMVCDFQRSVRCFSGMLFLQGAPCSREQARTRRQWQSGAALPPCGKPFASLLAV